MSTSPDTTATEDRLSGTEGLTPGQVEAIEELAQELDRVAPGQRGHVEMVARETVEVLALGE